ncbi:MAG: hypothetical protein LBP34_01505 [Flavobacteriaceae bacterium]|jgi:hypothetical protein|nr:hypothetical protein [Flavobacteriaceae bacterium]
MKPYLNFEAIRETETQKLIGGFSSAFGFFGGNEGNGTNNNCNGGNCLSGCNNKSPNEPKKGTIVRNSNCKAGANCVRGCGCRDKQTSQE